MISNITVLRPAGSLRHHLIVLYDTDPRSAYTAGGSLILNMSAQDPSTNHNLNYSSGMLQSWNQLCFTGGYIEVGVNLPGRPDVSGYWPGVWTMGNLGRAGYGASNEGTWPYAYDAYVRPHLEKQKEANL